MAIVRHGKQAVLIVIDFQVGVVKDCWDVPRVLANIVRAVDRARAHGVPVIWVQHEDDEMTRDSASWQLVPELVPAAGEFRICKRYASSFEETPLEQELARLVATRLVLAGAMTNWCIRAGAYAALERGYDVTLVSDAHTADSIIRRDGSVIEARGLVDDLNIAMTWLAYPGRKCEAVAADEVSFG